MNLFQKNIFPVFRNALIPYLQHHIARNNEPSKTPTSCWLHHTFQPSLTPQTCTYYLFFELKAQFRHEMN